VTCPTARRDGAFAPAVRRQIAEWHLRWSAILRTQQRETSVDVVSLRQQQAPSVISAFFWRRLEFFAAGFPPLGLSAQHLLRLTSGMLLSRGSPIQILLGELSTLGERQFKYNLSSITCAVSKPHVCGTRAQDQARRKRPPPVRRY
jgi:hypothetical protein